MQSTASRRALSYIASKLHPQLPLSPRESAQLLALLTSSFRAHLDRAHPVPPSDEGSKVRPPKKTSRGPANSSHVSAREHIDSILTNPLFAVKPHRRASDASRADAQSVLRDPLGWFLDQAAVGAADLSKAAICLQLLRTSQTAAQLRGGDRTKPATRIADWLRSSGLLSSTDFISYDATRLLYPLAAMLTQEGEAVRLWEWFAHDPQSGSKEQALDEAQVRAFRARLLRAIVMAKASSEPHIDGALSSFLHACTIQSNPESGIDAKLLRPAGFYLVSLIIAQHSTKSPKIYDQFLRSTRTWTTWHRRVESALCLHHPTTPRAGPAITYIRDPNGMAREILRVSRDRRKFLVHICLETARQCLAEQKFSDAQFVLEFARDGFPDLVDANPKPSSSAEEQALERKRQEEANLALLDRLLPT